MNCLHCGSKNVDKIMDEAVATWIKCRDCQLESVLGDDGSPSKLSLRLDGSKRD